jgi:hypothetical protein
MCKESSIKIFAGLGVLAARITIANVKVTAKI